MMIEYKGYIGVIDFDPEIDLFHGTVINRHYNVLIVSASVGFRFALPISVNLASFSSCWRGWKPLQQEEILQFFS